MWLHQANKSMKRFDRQEGSGPDRRTRKNSPIFCRTMPIPPRPARSSRFSQNSDDLTEGEIGLICSFGAGYSVGSVLLRRHL